MHDHATPAFPVYLVRFEPDAALRAELAAVLTGLDATAITQPPRATLTVEELLTGIALMFERRLLERGRGCQLVSPDRWPGAATARVVEVLDPRGHPVPPEVQADVEATLAAIRDDVLGKLREYRATHQRGG